MNFIAYENTDFLFFWKPHGLPSTFGKEKSFLGYLVEGNLEFNTSEYESLKKYLDSSLQEVKNIKSAILHQTQVFGKDKEFGLLNRLDNDTAGFLYFAKDLSIFEQYKQLQAHNKSEKHYIAQAHGKCDSQIIDFPIMHRGATKMMAIQSPKDLIKGRGKEHNVQTFVEALEYDKKSNISTLLVKIHKGIRHQIRVHLSSIGFPIIGDPLYGKDDDNFPSLQERGWGGGEILHLRSVGFKIQK